MTKSIHRSFGLDLARALAISFVILSHFGHVQLDALGFWGVELFFALSGFLIGHIIWRNFSAANNWSIQHLTNFWARRWWRTLPNYYLFFLLMLVFYHFNGDGLPSIGRLTDFLWFGQNLFSGTYGFYPVAWSLCIEEWFYLLFPIALFIFYKAGLKKTLAFSSTLILFFTASMVTRLVLLHVNGGGSLRTTTFARLDSIAAGVLIAFILSVANPGLIIKRCAFAVGLILVIVPLVLLKVQHTNMELLQQNPVLLIIVPFGFALMLPIFALLKAPAIAFVSTIVEKLSLWSYSMYLCHLPIMWIVYYLMRNYRDNAVGNLLSKLVGLGVTILVSALLFRFFEVPFTRKRPAELAP